MSVRKKTIKSLAGHVFSDHAENAYKVPQRDRQQQHRCTTDNNNNNNKE